MKDLRDLFLISQTFHQYIKNNENLRNKVFTPMLFNIYFSFFSMPEIDYKNNCVKPFIMYKISFLLFIFKTQTKHVR